MPFTISMLGFAFGNVVFGQAADRFGIVKPLIFSIVLLGIGYIAAALSPNLWLLCAAYGLIGFGSGTSFGPLIADLSQWFEKRRGIAIAIVASGNYFAGAIWPPVTQHFITTEGWRATHIGIGVFVVLAMLPITLIFRRGASAIANGGLQDAYFRPPDVGVSPNLLFVLICIAGFCCCVAMAMPQVHIVAYCGDLGYGVARGSEMLAFMLGFGIISRIGSGFIADRFGGVVTLTIGAVMQAAALGLYFLFDGLTSLYVISILFGLFQGGLVPSYSVIIREYFPPQEAGLRVGIAVLMTVFGMAFGGWISGFIFDMTGSYRAAFLNGLAFNLVTLTIAFWLLYSSGRRPRPAMA
jgi:MFS family permease